MTENSQVCCFSNFQNMHDSRTFLLYLRSSYFVIFELEVLILNIFVILWEYMESFLSIKGQ